MIQVDDFGVKSPPLFPPSYIVKVARIDAQLDLGALLHRQVVIKSLVLEQPTINLVSDPDGPWNFENPGAQNTPSTFLFGVVSRVEIKRGHVTVSNLLPSDAAGPVFFEAHDVSSELENVNVDAIAKSHFHYTRWRGDIEGGGAAVRFNRGEKSEFQYPAASETGFFHGRESGSVCGKRDGRTLD